MESSPQFSCNTMNGGFGAPTTQLRHMSMASQITGISTLCSTIFGLSKKTLKLHIAVETVLCDDVFMTLHTSGKLEIYHQRCFIYYFQNEVHIKRRCLQCNIKDSVGLLAFSEENLPVTCQFSHIGSVMRKPKT